MQIHSPPTHLQKLLWSTSVVSVVFYYTHTHTRVYGRSVWNISEKTAAAIENRRRKGKDEGRSHKRRRTQQQQQRQHYYLTAAACSNYSSNICRQYRSILWWIMDNSSSTHNYNNTNKLYCTVLFTIYWYTRITIWSASISTGTDHQVSTCTYQRQVIPSIGKRDKEEEIYSLLFGSNSNNSCNTNEQQCSIFSWPRIKNILVIVVASHEHQHQHQRLWVMMHGNKDDDNTRRGWRRED